MTSTDPIPDEDRLLDRYPGPALAYAIDGDSAVVRATNDAFVDAFEPVAAETSLRECFERLGLDPLDESECFFENDSTGVGLEQDQQLSVRVSAATGRGDAGGGEEFLLSVVPPTERAPGYLLFGREQKRTADVGVDSVASVVSHDLRNPLDVANARLRAARETGEDEHFEYVADAHERMEGIIEDVLTLARGEELIDPSESVELATVVETAWESVDTVGATLTTTDELPTVVADRDRARRLFENLFRNSVEHGGRKEGVSVVVGPLTDDVGVYVADDGPGIPEDDREAVFEPGYSTREHGTGLGLAIVQRIADGHDWSVRATDGTESGARFELSGMARVDER